MYLGVYVFKFLTVKLREMKRASQFLHTHAET
jgi:hypothetical protein